jgi:hypothetical protein
LGSNPRRALASLSTAPQDSKLSSEPIANCCCLFGGGHKENKCVMRIRDPTVHHAFEPKGMGKKGFRGRESVRREPRVRQCARFRRGTEAKAW